MRENIVKSSVHHPLRFSTLSKPNKDRVWSKFSSGQVRVNYIQLESCGFNQKYLDALTGLMREERERLSTGMDKKRKDVRNDAGGPRKRARGSGA